MPLYKWEVALNYADSPFGYSIGRNGYLQNILNILYFKKNDKHMNCYKICHLSKEKLMIYRSGNKNYNISFDRNVNKPVKNVSDALSVSSVYPNYFIMEFTFFEKLWQKAEFT